MLKTELKLPFVFYNALEKQHRFRSQNIYRLISPSDALLPFQIKKTIGGSYSEFQLCDLSDTPVVDLIGHAGLIEAKHTIDSEYLTYKGDSMGITIPNGCYYVKIVKGDAWYSETFTIADDLSPYVKLEWSNSCDIRPVMYQTGFVNKIYLESYIEVIPPEINEEGENNGAEDFIPLFQKVVYKNKTEFFAPDYLLDALAFMQINDNVIITDETDTSAIYRTKLTPVYGDDGYFGTGKIEFQLPGDYIRTNCCNNLVLTDGGGGGGGDSCDITITNITQTDIGEGVTQIDFTPVLNGSTVDHYQWRSTDVLGNAWQDIGTATTFQHTFSVGSITVDIEAICDNALAGTPASITFDTASGIAYTSGFTFDVTSGSVPSFIVGFTAAGFHYKIVWDNTAPGTFDEVVCTNAHTGYSSPTHSYIGAATGTVYFETGAVPETIDITEGSAGFTAIGNLGSFTSLAFFDCSNQSLTTLPSLPDSIMDVRCSNNSIGSFDISALLIQLDAAGNSSGFFQSDSQSPSAPPSGPASTAKANLIARGWTVLTD